MAGENLKKASFGTIFSVASVWFGSHAGGGFASGNQATVYYVSYGWYAPIMAVLAMALLAYVAREVIVMANINGFTSYKPLWEHMWAPYTKLEILFEVYFVIIVICAVSASIAGAASLLTDYNVPYALGVGLIGVCVLILTMFGANLVARASAVMSVIILVCIFAIFTFGILARTEQLGMVFAARETTGQLPKALIQVVAYAGFQCVMLPAFIGCASVLKTKKNCTRAAVLGFILNGAALGISCLMLLGWYKFGPIQDAAAYTLADQAVPNVYVCRQLGVKAFEIFYAVALFMCFVSTCVTSVYGMVPRFEGGKMFKSMSPMVRRLVISAVTICISMSFSMVGLTNIIKYGYQYCGYLGALIIVIPMVTIGRAKNKKQLAEHPELIGE